MIRTGIATKEKGNGGAIEIGLEVFTAKSCKGSRDLRILGHGGFLFVLR